MQFPRKPSTLPGILPNVLIGSFNGQTLHFPVSRGEIDFSPSGNETFLKRNILTESAPDFSIGFYYDCDNSLFPFKFVHQHVQLVGQFLQILPVQSNVRQALRKLYFLPLEIHEHLMIQTSELYHQKMNIQFFKTTYTVTQMMQLKREY